MLARTTHVQMTTCCVERLHRGSLQLEGAVSKTPGPDSKDSAPPPRPNPVGQSQGNCTLESKLIPLHPEMEEGKTVLASELNSVSFYWLEPQLAERPLLRAYSKESEISPYLSTKYLIRTSERFIKSLSSGYRF